MITLNIKELEGVYFLKCDLQKNDAIRSVEDYFQGKVDVLLSDMAPKTTGIRSVDSQRSLDINLRVLQISEEILKPNGILLVKAFQGETLNLLRKDFKKLFTEVKLCKPKSSRSESVEIFLIGLNKK